MPLIESTEYITKLVAKAKRTNVEKSKTAKPEKGLFESRERG